MNRETSSVLTVRLPKKYVSFMDEHLGTEWGSRNQFVNLAIKEYIVGKFRC